MRGELASEVIANSVGDAGPAGLTGGTCPPAVGRWLSDTGIVGGQIDEDSDELVLPLGTQTQRRLIAIANADKASTLNIAIYSKRSDGFEWAGGLPSDTINIRDYRRPPVQLDSVPIIAVKDLYVDTGTPWPDERVSIVNARDGAYVYVIGEERDTFQVRPQGEEQP